MCSVAAAVCWFISEYGCDVGADYACKQARILLIILEGINRYGPYLVFTACWTCCTFDK